MIKPSLLPILFLIGSACDSPPSTETTDTLSAAAALGEALWAQSCPVATIDGVCGHPTTTQNRVTCANQGHAHSAQPLTIVARDPKLVKAALAAFNDARTLFETNQAELQRDSSAVKTYQTARRALLAPSFEAYLALQFPSKLNFDPADPIGLKASTAAFKQWFEQKNSAAQELLRNFDAIQQSGIDQDLSSAARRAAIFENFAADMMHGEIPVSVRSGDFATETTRAYCDGLAAQALPLQAAAQR